MILPPDYYVWEHWRENGGLPKDRPPSLRKRIPQTWWVYYATRHPRPKPIQTYNGFFASKGALFRAPGGNIENTTEQKEVIKWSALDLRANGSWLTQISQNNKDGIVTLPWQMCYTEDDIDTVFKVASGVWGSKLSGHCWLNVEQEILTTLPPSRIRAKIDIYQHLYPNAEVGVIPLGWVQNGQGWSALRDVPVLLEVFTNERPEWTAAVLVEHANKEGLGIVGCMWGAYPINGQFPNPHNYPLGMYKIEAIYTGDDVQHWSDWK